MTEAARPEPNVAPQPARRRGLWWKLTAALLVVALLACEGVAVTVGWKLTHPVRKPVNDSPANYGLKFEAISFPSREDGLKLQGWYLPAQGAPSDKTVIIAHGFQGNRLETGPGALNVAKVLVSSGYNALLFDFRDSGESEGLEVTVGLKEVRDVAGAVDFVRSRGARRVALLGYSMGATTSLLAAARMPEVDAVVADSPFEDLGTLLIENAKNWTHLPTFPFSYMVYLTVPAMLHANLKDDSPISEVGALAKKPVFLIAGTADTAIPEHHSRDLMAAYAQAGGQKGEVWIVPGAKHVQAFKVAPDLYKEKLLDFLGGALK